VFPFSVTAGIVEATERNRKEHIVIPRLPARVKMLIAVVLTAGAAAVAAGPAAPGALADTWTGHAKSATAVVADTWVKHAPVRPADTWT
jgi:hypothetical protein